VPGWTPTGELLMVLSVVAKSREGVVTDGAGGAVVPWVAAMGRSHSV